MHPFSFRPRCGLAVVPEVSRTSTNAKYIAGMIACGFLMLALAGCDRSTVAPDLATDPAFAKANSSLTITPSSASVAVGETVQLTATSSSVQWSSSAPGVATISSSGLVTGLTAGEATITAKDRNKTAQAVVTVTAPFSTPATCSGHAYTRLVNVFTATQLANALEAAQPGDMIQMADGTYTGRFTIATSGTADKRVVLCGTPKAVISTGSLATGMYALTLQASYWTLNGFSVTDSQAGIQVRGGHHNVLEHLTVHAIGQEAVAINNLSTRNIIQNSRVYNTGLANAEYGEAVYIGSWNGHWCSRTNCEPDRSDYNQVLNNTLGPDVRAEHVEAKEGTTGGVISGNTFDGRGMVNSQGWVNSWVVVSGNGYIVTDNLGSASPVHGFKVEKQLDGWGNSNTFGNNIADVQASGYGFTIRVGTTGNVVRCANTVQNAAAGFSDMKCS